MHGGSGVLPVRSHHHRGINPFVISCANLILLCICQKGLFCLWRIQGFVLSPQLLQHPRAAGEQQRIQDSIKSADTESDNKLSNLKEEWTCLKTVTAFHEGASCVSWQPWAFSLATGGLARPALANVPTIALDTTKLEGNEFEVTVNIFHKGNNLFHYVNKVVLFADGEEVKMWKYAWRRRPESANFSVKTKVSVTQETVFSLVANCNLHGENKDNGRLVLSPGSTSK